LNFISFSPIYTKGHSASLSLIDESISYTLDKNDKDKSFLDIINESFKNQIISTVFLVGEIHLIRA